MLIWTEYLIDILFLKLLPPQVEMMGNFQQSNPKAILLWTLFVLCLDHKCAIIFHSLNLPTIMMLVLLGSLVLVFMLQVLFHHTTTTPLPSFSICFLRLLAVQWIESTFIYLTLSRWQSVVNRHLILKISQVQSLVQSPLISAWPVVKRVLDCSKAPRYW